MKMNNFFGKKSTIILSQRMELTFFHRVVPFNQARRLKSYIDRGKRKTKQLKLKSPIFFLTSWAVQFSEKRPNFTQRKKGHAEDFEGGYNGTVKASFRGLKNNGENARFSLKNRQ